MYKKQLIFQRIICMVMLFAAAIIFVYSLGLMTDLYDSLYSTMMDPEDYTQTSVTGSIIYYDMQQFNNDLTKASIGLILVTLVLFLTNTHTRRKYYIGNYIAVGLSTVCNVVISVWALTRIAAYRVQYKQIDFEQLKAHSELWNTYYTESTFWFDASYVVFGILLVVTVLLVGNLILKQIMMKEEKRLIGSRKEVGA
ncbi:MAG: hypothetical protein K2N63_12065 [Lachnospiraceae bacterium]|nr:hypothetical protein [Lachnospiraceae bacterium]